MIQQETSSSLQTGTRRRSAFAGLPIAFALSTLLLLAGGYAHAAQPSIDLLVPMIMPPTFQLSELQLTVQVDADVPVTFTVTSPDAMHAFPALTPGAAPVSHFFAVSGDNVNIEPPDGALAANDPRRRNYRLTISLGSDFDPASCQSLMAGPESWTVAVTGPEIDHACLISFDKFTDSCCDPLDPLCDVCKGCQRVIPNVMSGIAQIVDLDSAEQTCRFGVEAMLVLDRSGSMGIDAGNGDSRLASLRNAVDVFLDTLDTVRATETSNFGMAPNDQVGVVLFNGNDSNLAGVAAGLHGYTSMLADDINMGLVGTSASGSTSIGEGLIAADAHLGGAASDRRRVAILMSDGDQNTDMHVASDVAAGSVYTHMETTGCPMGAASPDCTELPNLANYDICSITAGSVSPAYEQVNQDIALASGCFYLNSLDFGDLPVFFTNVLQDFLATTSWQTVLEGAGSAGIGAPFSTSVPMTSTSAALTVAVMPEPKRVACLEVTAPDGTTFEASCNLGPVLFGRSAAQHAPQDLGGEWRIEVTDPETSSDRPTDFRLVVLADDLSVHASVDVGSASYAPGDPVLVEARLRDGAKPLTDLDTGGLEVRLASPEQTIGELMATVDPDASQATADDSLVAANAAIGNALADDPDALGRIESAVHLRDDGSGGDRVAGDGVYTARLSFEEYGAHDLVVLLNGRSPTSGAFRRQIEQTVFVKAVPDGDRSELDTRVVSGEGSRSLAISFTPRTRFGHPIGPGWGNYIWLQAPGVPPFKLADQLDGTYTGNLSFSGSPPDLSVHFIPDSVIIGDDVPPELLPSPLDDSTRLLTPGGGWSLSLHFGVNEPQSPLSTVADGGLSAGVDVEFPLTPSLGFELFAGYDEFAGSGGAPDLEVLHLVGDLRWYPGGGPWRPFLLAGLGAYKLDPGSTELGGVVGAGLQFPVTSTLDVETELRYHLVDANPDIDWFALHGGLRFRF